MLWVDTVVAVADVQLYVVQLERVSLLEFISLTLPCAVGVIRPAVRWLSADRSHTEQRNDLASCRTDDSCPSPSAGSASPSDATLLNLIIYRRHCSVFLPEGEAAVRAEQTVLQFRLSRC